MGDNLPRDHKGAELKIGDTVYVPCVVTGLDLHDEFINATLETVWPMYPGPNKTPVALNTRQTLLGRQSAVKKDSAAVIDMLETIKADECVVMRGAMQS